MLNGPLFTQFQSNVFKSKVSALPAQTIPLMGLSATTFVMLQTYKEKILHALEHMMLPAIALLTPAPIHVGDFIQQQTRPTLERMAPTGTHAPLSQLVQPISGSQFVAMLDQILTEAPLQSPPHGSPVGGNVLDEATHQNRLYGEYLSNSVFTGNLLKGIQPPQTQPLSLLSQSPNPYALGDKYTQKQSDPSDPSNLIFSKTGVRNIPVGNMIDQNLSEPSKRYPTPGGGPNPGASFDIILQRAETYYKFLNGLGRDLLEPDSCPDCTFLERGNLSHPESPDVISKFMPKKYAFEELLNKYNLIGNLSARQLHEATLKAIALKLVRPNDPFIQTSSSPYDIEDRPTLTPEDERLFSTAWENVYNQVKHSLGPFRANMELDNKGIYLRKIASNAGQSLREINFFEMLKSIPWHKTSFESLEGTLYNTFIYANRTVKNVGGIQERYSPSDANGMPKNLNRDAVQAASRWATTNGLARDDDWFINK